MGLQSGLSTRLTFDPESEWLGLYAPDGKSVIMLSDQPGHSSVYRVSTTGGGGLERLLVSNEDHYPGSISPDGETLYISTADSLGLMRLDALDLATGSVSRVHPDVPGALWRVSALGGSHARWSPEGDVIYYYDTAQSVLAVPVEKDLGGLSFGAPTVVLRGLEATFTSPYTVDGSTGDLVALRSLQDGRITSLELAFGWEGLLEKD